MTTNTTIRKKRHVITPYTSRYSLRFSERRFLLQLVDLICLQIALGLSMYLQWSGGAIEVNRALYFKWALTLSVLWYIASILSDTSNLRRAANAFSSTLSIGGAVLGTSLVFALIPILSPSLPTRRIYLVAFPVLALLFVCIWRLLYASVFSQAIFTRRMLIVGAGKAGSELLGILSPSEPSIKEPTQIGVELLGFVDDDPAKLNSSLSNVRVRGSSAELVQLSNDLRVDEVVLSITNVEQIRPELFEALLDCREQGIHVSTMTDMFMELTGRMPTQHIGRNLSAILPNEKPATHRLYLFVRRLIDLMFALIGCVLLVIIIPFIWLVNRFTSPGDLFFRQERVGSGGVPFDVIKFRSMVMNAEKTTGAVWAEKNDPRITKLGQFLRRTRIDEIPQFWNVLKGEMSLIGPRPERPHFVNQLGDDIPLYRLRHAVKPGMTGWAQVKYRYGASVEDSRMKLQYDLYYIKHQGAYLDLLILFKTIEVVLGMKGR